jgi:hypothetical protein
MNNEFEQKVERVKKLLADRNLIDTELKKIFGDDVIVTGVPQKEVKIITKKYVKKNKEGAVSPSNKSDRIRKMILQGKTVQQIADVIGCTPALVYVVKSKMKQSGELNRHAPIVETVISKDDEEEGIKEVASRNKEVAYDSPDRSGWD